NSLALPSTQSEACAATFPASATAMANIPQKGRTVTIPPTFNCTRPQWMSCEPALAPDQRLRQTSACARPALAAKNCIIATLITLDGSIVMAYWLLKTEPDCYSLDDLERDKKTVWDGVNNNLALKYMRQIKKGDLALIYHTGDEKAVVGVA